MHVKTDVFKQEMWYAYDDGKGSTLVPLKPERVREIIRQNKDGKKPFDRSDFIETVEVQKPDYTNVVGQDDLKRFEHTFKKKKKPNNNRKNQGKKKKPAHTSAKAKDGNQRKKPGNPNQKRRNNNNRKKKQEQPGNKTNKPNQKNDAK